MFEIFETLTLLAVRPLPAVALTIIPAAISLVAAVNQRNREDDQIGAWVQLITAMLLTIWMGLPWQPAPESLLPLRSVTLFAYAYVLQDWLRAAWNTGYRPAWAHRLVLLSLAFAGFAFYWSA